jgi:hypothetical protein
MISMGESDFISGARFNKNTRPIDVDIRGRGKTMIHYEKVVGAKRRHFLSREGKRELVNE